MSFTGSPPRAAALNGAFPIRGVPCNKRYIVAYDGIGAWVFSRAFFQVSVERRFPYISICYGRNQSGTAECFNSLCLLQKAKDKGFFVTFLIAAFSKPCALRSFTA